jgi:hypothetical protein
VTGTGRLRAVACQEIHVMIRASLTAARRDRSRRSPPARRILAALFGLSLLAGPAASRAQAIDTDANIVTAIDISESVASADMRAEVAALADALRSPELMAAVRRGRAGRIGFAVFAWHLQQYEILPWTTVGSREDAEAAARALESNVPVNVHAQAYRSTSHFIGRLTDLSRAIDHARDLATAADPGAPVVVNIIGNGADNVGEPAAPARARLLETGATVNAVVTGDEPGLAEYFRQNVAGGAGAFVIAASGAEALPELMRRKLLRDLVAALEPRRG